MNEGRWSAARRSRKAAVVVLVVLVLGAGAVVVDGGGSRARALMRQDEGGFEQEGGGGTASEGGGTSTQPPPPSEPETFTIYGQPRSSDGNYGPYGSGATAYGYIGPCHTDGPNELLSLPESEVTRLATLVRTTGSATVAIFSSDDKHAVRMEIQAANLLPGTTYVGIKSSTGNEKGIQGCNRSTGLTSNYVRTWSQARYMYLSRPSSPGAPGEDSLVMRSRDYFVFATTGFPDIFSWDPDTFWGLSSGNMVTFDWIKD